MSKQSISTFPRYIYLNSYAFLLFIVGIGIAFIPLYNISWWLTPLQAAGVFSCMKGGYKILSTWEDKKRKYNMLMERNKAQIRPDTFSEFMQAPCGQLLSKVVLHDLGHSEAYKELQALRKPLKERILVSCKPQKSVIYINENYIKP